MKITTNSDTLGKTSPQMSFDLPDGECHLILKGSVLNSVRMEDGHYVCEVYVWAGHAEQDEALATSHKGIELIKEFEGCRLVAYRCAAGVPTIGYGHTQGVEMGQQIDQWTADKYLRSDLIKFEAAVNESVTVPLSQNEFDALISFTFNVGINALKSSTLLQKLNGGDRTSAADEFLRWDKANGRTLPGLTRRRKAERALFIAG